MDQLKKGHKPIDYLDRLKLLLYNKRQFKDQSAANEISNIREEIESNKALSFAKLIFNKVETTATLKQQYNLTK